MKKRNRSIIWIGMLIGVSLFFSACGSPNSGDDTREAVEKGQNKEGEIISFSGKDIEGNEVISEDIFAKKKLTMVNVWATFCQPCIKELPDLDVLNKELEQENVQVVGVLSDIVDTEGNYSKENWELGKKIVNEKGVNFDTILCDVTTFSKQVVIDAVPTTFFVDAQGRLVGNVQIGSVSKEQYKELIENALNMLEE